jgi:hypothetical protein
MELQAQQELAVQMQLALRVMPVQVQLVEQLQ